MGDEELVTVREIAETLGMNYRTIIDYKNYFNDFMKPELDGEKVRYSAAYIDLFRLINALKEEGYSLPLIRMFLSGEVGLPAQRHVRDWLLVWMEEISHRGMDASVHTEMEGCIHPNADGGIHPKVEGCIHPHADGGIRTDAEENIHHGMEENIHPSADGGVHPHAEGCIHPQQEQQCKSRELTQEQLTHIKDQLISELCLLSKEQVDRSVREQIALLSMQLEDFFAELASSLNAGITQVYKAVHELQEGAIAIDRRLLKLEADLDVQAPEQMEFTELDLEELQLSSLRLTTRPMPGPEPEMPVFPHADLEFVRASIRNGKPDREAVTQWVHAEKAREPDVSYAELAERLDRAGIPTLRGQEGWNRGVVRNLAVRGNGNGNGSEEA